MHYRGRTRGLFATRSPSSVARHGSTAAALALLLAPLEASGSDPAPAQPAPSAASRAVTTHARPAAEPIPSPAAEERTAKEVFKDISAKVDSASLTTVYDEASDPNELLGRPNGYTSKVAFADSRVKFEDYEEQGWRRTTWTVVAPSRCSPTRRAPSCGLGTFRA